MPSFRKACIPLLVPFVLSLPLAAFAEGNSEGPLLTSAQSELHLGGSFIDPDEDTKISDGQYPSAGGDVRISFPLTDSISFQTDLEGTANFLDRGDGNGSENQGDQGYMSDARFAGHLTWRAPESGAVGLLVAGGQSNGGEDEGVLYWLVGGEAQY
ncbi:MAG: hypothetical protein AB8G23_22090 [Myxococcota bacterium]